MSLPLISPEWSAPANVLGAMTTRLGGISPPPYDSLNLGYSTDDERRNVEANERRVAEALGVSTHAIRWVYQVHGNGVRVADDLPSNEPLGAAAVEADAIVTRTPGLVCGVKVADCMPVLFASVDGRVVAAAHAGWRGLSSGVLENTLSEMRVAPNEIVVWLGPCIGAAKFEVGEEVRAAFLAQSPAGSRETIAAAFVALPTAGKHLCDLRAIARERLRAAGVTRVFASDACTMSEPKRFFSHRRDRTTGRMAAFVGIKA